MTGFSPGANDLSPQLREVFRNHSIMGYDERDTYSMMENLYRAIAAGVQYNQTVYVGTCGGAMIAGRSFLGIRNQCFDRQMKLFDFCIWGFASV